MAYQSLYRRYRPSRFAELRGQDHVVAALRNAVRDDRTGHAYLFSGPRGTGKTSTARILAKALNCEALDGGEPCGECTSCRSIESGTSYDVHELDAASNNGVEAMRDLIEKAAWGTGGRRKVYILDEVHMLSAAASNALLKTLEEPPDHVTFVLATTDPQKVLPTIRSRTQPFAFGLLSAAELADYVRWVIADAGLDVADDAVDFVVRQGAGSARDTLSALDQVAAAGGVAVADTSLEAMAGALVARDPVAALGAVSDAIGRGREPRLIGELLLGRLRDAFLVAMGASVAHLAEAEQVEADSLASGLGAPALTRALELVGTALMEMRQAPEPRIPLEVALVRLTRPELDPNPAALLERIERIEVAVSQRASLPAASPTATGSGAPDGEGALRPGPSGPVAAGDNERIRVGPAAEARRKLAEKRAQAAGASPPPAPPVGEPTVAPSPADPPSEGAAVAPPLVGEGAGPTSSEIAEALEVVKLAPMAKALFRAGRFTAGEDGVRCALPNEIHRKKCEEKRADVEAALSTHFGRPVRLELVTDTAGPARPLARSSQGESESPDESMDEIGDVDQLDDAPDQRSSGVELLTEKFPGAVLIEEDDANG